MVTISTLLIVTIVMLITIYCIVMVKVKVLVTLILVTILKMQEVGAVAPVLNKVIVDSTQVHMIEPLTAPTVFQGSQCH